MTSDFAVALFRTNSAAVRAERILLRADLEARLVPVPREFSNVCGLAVRILWEHRRVASELIRAAGLEIAAIYRLGAEAAADAGRANAT